MVKKNTKKINIPQFCDYKISYLNSIMFFVIKSDELVTSGCSKLDSLNVFNSIDCWCDAESTSSMNVDDDVTDFLLLNTLILNFSTSYNNALT